MLDLMFAAALSGMRAAETPENGQLMSLDYTLVPGTRQKAPERDWRKWVSSDFTSFEDERDCPVFFQKDLPGFGTMRLSSLCNADEED